MSDGFPLKVARFMAENPIPPFPLLPDNAPAVALLMAVATQWRTGPAGVIGLDYSTLFALLDRRGMAHAEQIDLLESVQVMESEVLRVIHGNKVH